MFNQIKAELFKLFKAKSIYLMILVVITIIVLASLECVSLYGAGAVCFSETTVEFGFKTAGNLGFIIGGSSEVINPSFKTISTYSLGLTWIFAFACIPFTLNYFCKEFKQSTIKITVASGLNITRIYLTKFLVMNLIVICLYSILCVSTFLIEVNLRDYALTFLNVLEYFILILANSIVYIAFISIIMLTSIITRNVALVNTIYSLLLFSPSFFYGNVIRAEYYGMPLELLYKILLYPNPMYYFTNLSNGIVSFNQISQVLIYGVITISFCLTIFSYIAKKIEKY